MKLSNSMDPTPYNYVRLTPQLWVREDQNSLIEQIDSLILDIDGVLIDVTPSFRVAISQTVQHYFCRILDFKGDKILVKPSETQLFKRAGGFNNDWDLTAAAILFYLTKSELLNTQDIDQVQQQGQTIEEHTVAVRRLGGGIDGAREIMLTTLSREQRRNVDKKWDRVVIERTFQELYGGVDYCKKLYGFKPSYNRRQGLLNEERVMIKKEEIKPYLPRVGILTGRTKGETEVALEKTDLKDMVDPENITSDGAIAPEKRKPQPDALIELGRKLAGAVTVYVGDVFDDLMIVRNANLCKESSSVFLSCLVISPLRREEVDFYQKEGADIIAMDVNEVLRILAPGKE